ncbi:MAG: pyridoxamine 5'-phosphate oxidase family protein, partial [Firmicutes bacterium]|nr:pyridoxamine 5'-phosphate oxidase family protein [Bacillota bacterium]
MRRIDKEIKDPAELEAVLDRAEWGTLGLVSPDGEAVLVPLNVVRLGNSLFFHGSPVGQKMQIIGEGCRATFLVVEAFARIPSYALDPVNACPATQLFKSVLAYGRISVVSSPERRAMALQALMEKLQPEGGHEAIDAGNPHYHGRLQSTAVLEMTLERLTGKFAFGQKWTPERRDHVTDFLRQRGEPLDQAT